MKASGQRELDLEAGPDRNLLVARGFLTEAGACPPNGVTDTSGEAELWGANLFIPALLWAVLGT